MIGLDQSSSSTSSVVGQQKLTPSQAARELQKLGGHLKQACDNVQENLSALREDLSDADVPSADLCSQNARALYGALIPLGKIVQLSKEILENKKLTEIATYQTEEKESTEVMEVGEVMDFEDLCNDTDNNSVNNHESGDDDFVSQSALKSDRKPKTKRAVKGRRERESTPVENSDSKEIPDAIVLDDEESVENGIQSDSPLLNDEPMVENDISASSSPPIIEHEDPVGTSNKDAIDGDAVTEEIIEDVTENDTVRVVNIDEVSSNEVQTPAKESPEEEEKNEVQTPAKESPEEEEKKVKKKEKVTQMEHASRCKNRHCLEDDCKEYKNIFKHAESCKKRKEKACTPCKRLIGFVCVHAKICEENKCQVPFCKKVKNKLNNLKTNGSSSMEELLSHVKDCSVMVGKRVDNKKELTRIAEMEKVVINLGYSTNGDDSTESSSESSSDDDFVSHNKSANASKLSNCEVKKKQSKKSKKKSSNDSDDSEASIDRLLATGIDVGRQEVGDSDSADNSSKKKTTYNKKTEKIESEDLFPVCDQQEEMQTEEMLNREAEQALQKINGELPPDFSEDPPDEQNVSQENEQNVSQENEEESCTSPGFDVPSVDEKQSKKKEKPSGSSISTGGGECSGTNKKKKEKSDDAKQCESGRNSVVDLVDDNDDEEVVYSTDDELRKTKRLLQKSIPKLSSSDESDAEAPKSQAVKKPKSKKQSNKKGDKRKRIVSSDSDNNSSDSSDTPDIDISVSDSDKESKKKKKADEDFDVLSVDSNSESDDDFRSMKRKGKTRAATKKKSTKKPNAKRRRVKSDSDESDDEHDASQGSGRKRIKKIMKTSELAEETRDAEKSEKDRRKRLSQRQKEFNGIRFEEQPDSIDGLSVKRVKELVLDTHTQEGQDIKVEVHPSLCKILKSHQAEGIQFLYNTSFESVDRFLRGDPGGGGILAHCMGLGKTLQVIAYIHTIMSHEIFSDEIKTVLVLVPVNVLHNWHREFQQWLDENDEELNTINIYKFINLNSVKQRAELLNGWMRNGGVMIMGYDMYRGLLDEKSKGKKVKTAFKQTFLKCLRDPGPDIVVCDEGHKLKSDETKLSKSLTQIRTRRRICLTGTPLQNNLIEYHCMVNFVRRDLLGNKKEFTNRFANPIKNGQYSNSSIGDVRIMKFRSHVLFKLLDKVVLRRDYRALATAIPGKHEYVISVRLSERQIKLYQYFLEHVVGSTDADSLKVRHKLLPDFHIISRICTHPYMLAQHQEDVKLKEERQQLFREENDFVVSGSDTGEESSSSRYSDRDKADGSEKSDNNNSDGDEVIKRHKTRRRGGAGGDVEIIDIANTAADRETPEEMKHWWEQSGLVQEDDQFNVELSGKLTLLFEIVKMCEKIGDKILVFSQSLESLNLIESFLHYYQDSGTWFSDDHEALSGDQNWGWEKGRDYFRLDGSVGVDLRKKFQDSFNHKKNLRARLFLISTRAGSLGINMVGANRVVIFDACWNPTHDTQSLFRVYRFGQTKPVYIYRLIAQGTMEERIYDRQVTKESLSLRVVDEQQIERHYFDRDLSELYKFNPDTLDPDANKDRPQGVVPQDRLLADLLLDKKGFIVRHHEHDSLLQHKEEETLSKEEQESAWTDYEQEREGRRTNVGHGMAGAMGYNAQMANLQQLLERELDTTVEILGRRLGYNIETLKEMTKAKRRMEEIVQALPADKRGSIKNIDEFVRELLIPNTPGARPRTAAEAVEGMETTKNQLETSLIDENMELRIQQNRIEKEVQQQRIRDMIRQMHQQQFQLQQQEMLMRRQMMNPVNAGWENTTQQ